MISCDLEDHGAFDDVLELRTLPGQAVFEEELLRLSRDPLDVLVAFLAEMPHKVPRRE